MGTGMTLSFAVIGVAFGVLGDYLNISPDAVREGAAFMLVAFGLIMLVPWLNERFTNLISPLASSAHKSSTTLDTGSLRGAFMMGACWA